MSLAERCEKYFGSKDLYQVLGIPNQASQKDVRKAYHKLSLSCHPDRAVEEDKIEATEKFKVLGKVHSILSDPGKRTIYDETGTWGDDDGEGNYEKQDWMEYWSLLFKKVTLSDLNKYENEYKGSEEELKDIKEAYEKFEGDMDKIYENVQFVTLDDEDRIRAQIQELIDREEVPQYDLFTNEPQEKRDRRMRKLRKEAKEAEEEYEKIGMHEENGLAALEKAILARRRESTDSLISELEKKYAGPKMSKNTRRKSSSGKSKK